MQLAAWGLICAGLAWVTRRHPVVAPILVLVIWVLVPAVAADVITGRDSGLLGAHPAVWLVLLSLAAQLVHDPQRVLRVVVDRIFLIISLALVVAVAAFTTQQSGTGGLPLLLDQVVGPVGLFVLLLAAVDGHRQRLDAVRTTLLALGAFSAVLALVQWATGSVLLYEAQFSTRWWFARPGFDRWMATFDHPLTLSLFLCVTGPLVVGLRRPGLQLALLSVFAAAVTITQSRSGVVILAIVAVWVVLRARMAAHVRLLSLCALVAATAALLASGLVEGVVGRFADDTGSTGARTDALEFFGRTWSDYLTVGHGLTSSYRLAAQGGLETSLENSFLMYAVDIGILFAVLYFGAQAVLVVQAWTRPVQLPGVRQAALIIFLLPMTYSALAARSAVGAILWAVLALAVARGETAAPENPDPLPGTGAGNSVAARPPHPGHQGAVLVPLSRRTVTG